MKHDICAEVDSVPRLPTELQLQILSHLPGQSSVAARCMKVCRAWSLASETEAILYRHPFTELGAVNLEQECLDRISQLLGILIQDGETAGSKKCPLVESFNLQSSHLKEKNLRYISTRFNNLLHPTFGVQLDAVVPRLTNLRSLTLTDALAPSFNWVRWFHRGSGVTVVQYPKLEHIALTVEWFDQLDHFLRTHHTVTQLELLDTDIDPESGIVKYHKLNRSYVRKLHGPLILPALSSLSGNLHTMRSFKDERPLRRVVYTEDLAHPDLGASWVLRGLFRWGKVPLQELVLDRVMDGTFWDLLREISKAGDTGNGKGGLKVLRVMRLLELEDVVTRDGSSPDVPSSVDPERIGSSHLFIANKSSTHVDTFPHAEQPFFPALASLSLLFSFHSSSRQGSPMSGSLLKTQLPLIFGSDNDAMIKEENQFCETLSTPRRFPQLERIVCGVRETSWVSERGESWIALDTRVELA